MVEKRMTISGIDDDGKGEELSKSHKQGFSSPPAFYPKLEFTPKTRIL